VLACVVCLPLLSGCAFFGIGPSRAVAEDAATRVYRAAMADLSDCVTSADPAARAALALRLSAAADSLAAEQRPTNPDHFFMMDRVTAAAAHCAGLG
jgi:hypothetical protein